MVEPEMPFYELSDNMDLAETFIKAIVGSTLDQCTDDMEFFNERIDRTVVSTLENIRGSDFIRLTYTEAVDLLVTSGRSFEFPVQWGSDLQSEHERFLTEEHFNKVQ